MKQQLIIDFIIEFVPKIHEISLLLVAKSCEINVKAISRTRLPTTPRNATAPLNGTPLVRSPGGRCRRASLTLVLSELPKRAANARLKAQQCCEQRSAAKAAEKEAPGIWQGGMRGWGGAWVGLGVGQLGLVGVSWLL